MKKQNSITDSAVQFTEAEYRPLNRKRKAALIAVCTLTALVLACACAFAVYVGTYSRADDGAIDSFLSTHLTADVMIERERNGDITIKARDCSPTTAIIFYPGGKVEHTAYIPLMAKCAEEGMLCVISKMPFNLAFFDTGAAKAIKKAHPEIDSWYIGGHSLGGIAASSYLKKQASEFDGLILLGSYSATDLSDTELRVLTVRGTNDEIVTSEDHGQNLKNLPDGYTEAFIEGGCHAYFGMYGEQKGDGEPSISPSDQIAQAAYLITSFIKLPTADG